MPGLAYGHIPKRQVPEEQVQWAQALVPSPHNWQMSGRAPWQSWATVQAQVWVTHAPPSQVK